MLNGDQTIKMGGKGKKKEESVDELLAKLAQKGKKVRLLDESASVRELPNEDEDDDIEREIPNIKYKGNKENE